VSESPFPRLDLAPKLSRPLRLRWPLDYLRLLYWACFFPQAIRWYVETFGERKYREGKGLGAMWDAIRHDSVVRRLVLQAFLCLGFAVLTAVLLLVLAKIPVFWAGLGGGIIYGITLGLTTGVVDGARGSAADAVAGGIRSLVVVGLVATLASVMLGRMLGLTLGVLAGVVSSNALTVLHQEEEERSRGVRAFLSGLLVSSGLALALGLTHLLTSRQGSGPAVSSTISAVMLYGIAFLIVSCRAISWVLAWPVVCLSKYTRWPSHVSWLPYPNTQSVLVGWLDRDWSVGVHNANQLLLYSFQTISVAGALALAIEKSCKELLLSRCAFLADHFVAWELLFWAAHLPNKDAARRRWIWDWLIWPQSLAVSQNWSAALGFFRWHKQDVREALISFQAVQSLRYGTELHGTAHCIVEGYATATLDNLSNWNQAVSWLDALPDPELRPGTLQALRILRGVALEARLAQNAFGPLNRSAALGRANARLTGLIQTVDSTCPYPEWPLIKHISAKWRDIVSKAGGVIGEGILREPVLNPYEGNSGLPVTGSTFVGRENILRHIEDCWAGGAQPPPLIIFGHRRMGKSSILRNLNQIASANTILVYLDMQDAGWVDHTGQLLLDFAEAIHRRTVEAGLDAAQLPIEADYADLGTARRSFNALLDHLDGQMAGRRLILAMDEYEVIEEGIAKGRIDSDIPRYLRSKAAEYRWLALIFAGLHTLDEMGHDYRSAFYGQAEHIRVGYLSHDDAIRLITQPHPDFALEYEPELREELYRLTYGQPYLLQRLCWELVNNWNERFLREGESAPRTLTMDDLEPVLTPDFYQAAGYYFDGVWSNVTEAERQLMRVIAGRVEGTWTLAELTAAAELPEDAVRASLDLLRRHDVIVDEAGGVRFAAELMRRWVAKYGGTT
jgi:hypothetical protein